VVGIVASTGGPGALATVLGALDAAIPVPILVVQHLADGFCDGLRRWLGRACSLAVREAADGARLDPGTAHIAPVGWHLTVDARCRIELQDTPPVAGHRPSGTLMLRSLADAFGERALGVVLTGMGRDGAEGLLALYHAGAPTIAQDDETSVVGGMPGAARRLGAARQVLALTEIAAAITGAATGALSVTD
jgi:two-component system chemotaxis response regulator CheB